MRINQITFGLDHMPHTTHSNNTAKGNSHSEWGPLPYHAPSQLCDLGIPLWASTSSFVRQGWQHPPHSLAKIKSVKHLSTLPVQQLQSCWMRDALMVNATSINGFRTEAVPGPHRPEFDRFFSQWTLGKASPQRGGSWTLLNELCQHVQDAHGKTGVF